MPSLREVATQALEACEQRLPLKGQAAIIDELNNLRAALAEPRPIHECYGDCPTNPQTCPNPCNFEGRPRPVQEPVAWSFELAMTRGEHGYADWSGRRVTQFKPNVPEGSIRNLTPLYTSPPQRKPLTEWQINDLMANIDPEDVDSWSFRQGVYAAEKHHGVRR